MKLLPEKRRSVSQNDPSLDQSSEQFDSCGIGKGNSSKIQNQRMPVLQVRSAGRAELLHPWPNDAPFQDQYNVFGVILFSYRNSQHSVHSLPMVSVKAPEVPNSEQSADPHQLIEMASAYVIKGALVSPSPTAGGDRDPISPHGGSWAHRISWRDAECRASSSGC